MFDLRRFDRSTTVFVGLLVISFLLATFDVRAQGEGVGDNLRSGVQSLFTPMQRFAGLLMSPIVGTVDAVSDLAGLREDNELLQSRVRELEEELADTATLRQQVTELEAVLGLEPPGELNSVTARVIAAGASEFDFVRKIDVGTADGVLKGMPVIDEDGLVGRVILVTESNALVRLITDPSLSVGVRVKETNETGVVEGQGTGELRVEMFGAVDPLLEGYRLVTAGSRFPPGIPVGVIAEPATAEAGFQLIARANPAIRVSKLDFVRVIIDFDPLELDPDLEQEGADLSGVPPTEQEAPTP